MAPGASRKRRVVFVAEITLPGDVLSSGTSPSDLLSLNGPGSRRRYTLSWDNEYDLSAAMVGAAGWSPAVDIVASPDSLSRP